MNDPWIPWDPVICLIIDEHTPLGDRSVNADGQPANLSSDVDNLTLESPSC